MHTEPLQNGRTVLVDDTCTFGIDAVLLSAFSAPYATARSCDLGTGCGIIPLLWELPSTATVDAVDCSAHAVSLLQQTVQQNGLADSITVWKEDWCNLSLPHGAYRCVVSNPPYFTQNSGKVSAVAERRLARHETETTLSDVVAAAAQLLQNGGHFCLCHRPERLVDVLTVLRTHRLEPKRLQWVHARRNTAPFLFLCDAVKNGKPSLSVLSPCFIEEETCLCPAP